VRHKNRLLTIPKKVQREFADYPLEQNSVVIAFRDDDFGPDFVGMLRQAAARLALDAMTPGQFQREAPLDRADGRSRRRRRGYA
jgi:hypothetical protein